MHKHIFPHGDYDHMGEAINLVNNFKVEKVIFNCGEFNDLERDLIKVLDKKQIPYYLEWDLERNVLEHLKEFILELGKDFTFVGNQVRITTDTDYFYPDLVFYNRILNCFVIIDFKIGKVSHKDICQMQMYVNYYDREIKK